MVHDIPKPPRFGLSLFAKPASLSIEPSVDTSLIDADYSWSSMHKTNDSSGHRLELFPFSGPSEASLPATVSGEIYDLRVPKVPDTTPLFATSFNRQSVRRAQTLPIPKKQPNVSNLSRLRIILNAFKKWWEPNISTSFDLSTQNVVLCMLAKCIDQYNRLLQLFLNDLSKTERQFHLQTCFFQRIRMIVFAKKIPNMSR